MLLHLLLFSTAIIGSEAVANASEAPMEERRLEDHAVYCFGDFPWPARFLANISEQDKSALTSEFNVQDKGPKFNNTAQLEFYVSLLYPATYSLYTQFKQFIEEKMQEFHFGEEATKFIDSLLKESIVTLSQLNPEELSEEQKMFIMNKESVVIIKKLLASYHSLSSAARTDLERFLCIRTYYRVLTERAESEWAIAQYKAGMDAVQPLNLAVY